MTRPTLATRDGLGPRRASAQQTKVDTHFWGAASRPRGTLRVSKASSNENRALKQHKGRGLPSAHFGAARLPLIQ